MDNKHKHLEWIQGVINRMASNSFTLKGWAVTLVAGIFALANTDADKIYYLVAYIPILIFWGLDAYYLLQEKSYRALYEDVRKKSNEKIDYSMNARIIVKQKDEYTWWKCIWAPVEVGFYAPLAGLTYFVTCFVW